MTKLSSIATNQPGIFLVFSNCSSTSESDSSVSGTSKADCDGKTWSYGININYITQFLNRFLKKKQQCKKTINQDHHNITIIFFFDMVCYICLQKWNIIITSGAITKKKISITHLLSKHFPRLYFPFEQAQVMLCHNKRKPQHIHVKYHQTALTWQKLLESIVTKMLMIVLFLNSELQSIFKKLFGNLMTLKLVWKLTCVAMMSNQDVFKLSWNYRSRTFMQHNLGNDFLFTGM